MERSSLESYVINDILADDYGGNRGLTVGKHQILLYLDEKARANFLELLENLKGTRNRLKKDIDWLTIRRLIGRETYHGSETFSILEKGKFLLALLREYEDGAQTAEAEQSAIIPFIERLRSTSVPIGKYLEDFAEEYELIGQRLQLKAQLIRETINEDEIEG